MDTNYPQRRIADNLDYDLGGGRTVSDAIAERFGRVDPAKEPALAEAIELLARELDRQQR